VRPHGWLYFPRSNGEVSPLKTPCLYNIISSTRFEEPVEIQRISKQEKNERSKEGKFIVYDVRDQVKKIGIFFFFICRIAIYKRVKFECIETLDF